MTTQTHPFYVDGKGWTDAGELTEQDNVLAYGERKLRVEGIWIEELSEPVKVYNFEVEEYHTYYVGEAEVLVHNNNCGQGNEGDSKTILYTDYDNIYKSSIHNVGKDKVMLGKYDGGGATSYITKAGNEYEYFSLGKDWDTIKVKYGYTDNDMFKLFNEAFLDDGINAGKTFHFSHNPIDDTGALGQEYQYLLNNNYKWDAETMTMHP